MDEPRPTRPLKSAILNRIAASRDPLARLKARRWGLDLLLRKPPTLELYFEAGDPHSQLCAQLLPALSQRLRVPLKVRLVGPPSEALYPEADRQRRYALEDARRIAPAWGLEFPEQPILPDEPARLLATRILAPATAPADFAARAASIAPALFGGDGEGLRARAEAGPCSMLPQARLLLRGNALRREFLGHYLPGMWQFDGEWFWGLDRLHHLEARLRAAGALQGDEPLCRFDPRAARLPPPPATLPPLEFFYSFRSPYSYLAAEAVARWAGRLDLQIRPVLPMAMRGYKVPAAKRLYIVRDVRREADHLGLPFGRIADPLGAGAERCLRVFTLAQGSEQQLALLRAASRAVWTLGLDVATDEGLRWVCDAAGIAWPDADRLLAGPVDLAYAEANRQALLDAGCWGVPSFRLGDFVTWGRDRMWMIDELLRRA